MPNIRPFSLTTLETPRIIFCFIEYVKSPRVIKIFLTKKSRRKNFKPKKFFDHPRHLKSGVPSPPVISNKTPKHPCTKINPLPPQKKHAKYQSLLANNTRDTLDHLLFHWIRKKSPRNQNCSNQKIPEKKFKPKKFFDHPRHLKSGLPSPPVI